MADDLPIPEPQSWVLRGAGQYGSDVEVVSLEAYQRLAQRCRNAEASALIWGRQCILQERGNVVALEDADVLEALRLPAAALQRNEQT